MTSLMAGTGRLNVQCRHGDKSQFIMLRSDRETDGVREMKTERERGNERVPLCFPLWLDSHLVTMCDRSSRANDGLPEASSIRPSLTGLPEKEPEREMTIDMLFTIYVCLYV